MVKNPIPSHLNQRTLLTKMLEIMKMVHSKADFTPEYISKVFGVKLDVSKTGEFIFWGQLTPNWEYYFDRDLDGDLSENNFVFSLVFQKKNKLPNVSMSEICDMDIEEFIQKAQSLGYIQLPLYRRNYPIPGIVLKRDKLVLLVEADSELFINGKHCIKRIITD